MKQINGQIQTARNAKVAAEQKVRELEGQKSGLEKDVENLKAEGIIAGGMIPKVDCITHALKGNMSKAVIIDGRIPHSILIEILSKDGSGTLFTR